MIFFCLFNLLCAGKSDKKIILGTTITYTILLYNRLTNFLFPGNYFQRNQASNQVNIIEEKKMYFNFVNMFSTRGVYRVIIIYYFVKAQKFPHRALAN